MTQHLKKYGIAIILGIFFIVPNAKALGDLWAQATPNAAWAARGTFEALVFDDKMWVLGGYDGSYYNDVWCSADGINWIQATVNAPWEGRDTFAAVSFNGKMWVMGGTGSGTEHMNDVWYSDAGATCSAGGVTWTKTSAAGWDIRNAHTGLVFGGKVWIFGGNDGNFFNDVWYSNDPSFANNWKEATATAWSSARDGIAAIEFGNKMWVLGCNGGCQEVYSSGDGITWNQSLPAPAWSSRSTQSLSFDGKMWVLGGLSGGGTKNDVWYSGDGINWMPATVSALWPKRYAHKALVFKNKMWIMGGISASGGIYYNDVWYSTFPASCTLSASSVFSGGTPEISWTTQYAVSAAINPGIIGPVTPISGGSASAAAPIAASTTYTMTVTGEGGDVATCSDIAALRIPPLGGLVPCGRLGDNPATPWIETAPCTLCSLILMGQLIIEFLVKMAAIAALVSIAAGGFLYVFAIGSQGTIEKAKSMIKYTLTGFVIIFIAWALINTIIATTGYIDPLGGDWYAINC